jgi:hypothetical protein
MGLRDRIGIDISRRLTPEFGAECVAPDPSRDVVKFQAGQRGEKSKVIKTAGIRTD